MNMKKSMGFFIVFIICTLLVTCNASKGNNNDAINSATWSKIKDTTWNNYDIWAGDGMYFFENKGKAYCKVMLYGSGVSIAREFVSVVSIEKENGIVISIPAEMELLESVGKTKLDELKTVICTLENERIIRDNRIYKKSRIITNLNQ